jgi:DNA-binding NtrC family response regulator
MNAPPVIYLVDDDEDDRLLFEESLREIDIPVTVQTFDNAYSFLKLMESTEKVVPHIVFLDLNMPLMNGEECLHKIRENVSWEGIKIIIYSTSMDIMKVEELKKAGANHYLKKPGSYDQLKRSLRDTIQRWTTTSVSNPPFIL